jgi:anti-sigma regulatory factor (Ser/Thr protein kinase)
MTCPEQAVSVAPLMALISLPRTRPAVSGARHWLADTLTAWNIGGDQLDDAVLVLSEVFTNSVEHVAGDGNATVTAALWRGHLRITVSDPDPETRTAAGDDEHGRGLQVVRALATRHGVTRTAGGKVVWAEQLVTTAHGCPDCGHLPGCGCDCCPYPLPAVAGVAR